VKDFVWLDSERQPGNESLLSYHTSEWQGTGCSWKLLQWLACVVLMQNILINEISITQK